MIQIKIDNERFDTKLTRIPNSPKGKNALYNKTTNFSVYIFLCIFALGC